MKRSFSDVLFESRRLKKNAIVVTHVTPEDPQYLQETCFSRRGEMQLAEQPAGISNEKSHLLMSSLDFRGSVCATAEEPFRQTTDKTKVAACD